MSSQALIITPKPIPLQKASKGEPQADPSPRSKAGIEALEGNSFVKFLSFFRLWKQRPLPLKPL